MLLEKAQEKRVILIWGCHGIS